MARDADTLAEVRAGSLVAGEFELIERIGAGGMGMVWRGRTVSTSRPVAVKLVGSGLFDLPARRRFEREAKLLARLGKRCTNLVRLLDQGVDPLIGPFLVMELLSGETLARRIDPRLRLPPKETVSLIEGLCRALEVAHAAGVVHRDVKPGNLFLHRESPEAPEIVKLLDFGVAKQRIDDEDSFLTRAGTVLGTPHYMAPEQMLGDTSLDSRADLWSVGVLTYRLLTGRVPFGQTDAPDLAAAILAQQPPPPSMLVPALPPGVDAWMNKALSKKPAERFQDARSMARELAEILANVPVPPPRNAPPEAPRSIPPEPHPEARTGRHAKGVNLIDLVKLLRISRREGKLGQLDPADQALIDERILVSSWYPVEWFWRALELARDRVLAGSDEHTVELGVAGAMSVMGGVHSVYVAGQDLERSLRSIERGWASYFDFGTVRAERDGNLVRVQVWDYPDMPRAHGLTTLGWFRATFALLGLPTKEARIVEEPWAGAPSYVIEIELDR